MIFVTVIAVSVDAYVAGLSLGGCGRVSVPTLLYISAFSFVMPLAVMLLASAAAEELDWLTAASSCIIIILGVRGLLPERTSRRELLQRGSRCGLSRATLMGLSLAADTSVGAAALAGESLAAAVPPLAFAAHFVLLSAGALTVKLLGVSRAIATAASAAMIVLGVLRMIG